MKAAKAVKAAAEKVDAEVKEYNKLSAAKTPAAAAVNKSTKNTSIAKVTVEHVAAVTNKSTKPLNRNATHNLLPVHHDMLKANGNDPVSLASFYATEDRKEALKTGWKWEPASTVSSVPNWIAPLSLFWRPPAHFVPPDYKKPHQKVSLVAQNWNLRGGTAAGTVAAMEKTADEAMRTCF